MNDELKAKIDAFVAERPEHTIVIDHNEMVEGLLAIAVQYAEEREAKARIDELQNIQKYWSDLSMVVPRLQASPPQVKQHIAERLARLKEKQ
jgi:hypothetical protein